jgi:hypothetical protein
MKFYHSSELLISGEAVNFLFEKHHHHAAKSEAVCVGRQFSGPATLEEAPCRELLLHNDLFLKHQ